MGEAGRTVLVAEDDTSLRFLCRVNLEAEGYRVLEASTLAAARQALAENAVDVLLLDVHLGDEDGRELLRELREEQRPVGVALFTGSAELAADDGQAADEVLPKPFSLEDLTATVRRLGERGRG